MNFVQRFIEAISPTARLQAAARPRLDGPLPLPPGVRDLGIVDARYDQWVNSSTGMGTSTRDKFQAGYFSTFDALDFGEIESLYYGEDMCERIVDELPNEAQRRGFKLEGPQAEVGEKALRALRFKVKLRDAHGFARLWGGAGLVLGLDDGQMSDKPVDVQRCRGVKFINVVDRRYIQPVGYYEDPALADFGEPETYRVTPAFGVTSMPGGGLIHESRIIRFLGTRIDHIARKRLDGWSYSTLQRPYDILRLFAHAFQATGQLLADAGQGVFMVKGLITQMSGPNRNAILQRFASLDQQRWAGRMLLTDMDGEKFAREPVQVAGIADLLNHIEMRLAAAARMPVTKLMGRAPAGLDATGDSDTRNWYEQVKAVQVDALEPAIARFLDLATQGAWSADEANVVQWNSLEDPNDKEEAEVEQLEASTWKLYVDMGAISGEEVALVQFAGKPIEEVIDEDALFAIVEANYEAAENPPAPLPGTALPGQIPPPKSPPIPGQAPLAPAAPPAPKADAAPTFAQRNASFLADIRDLRDNGLQINQGTVDQLAKQHGVPSQRLKD